MSKASCPKPCSRLVRTDIINNRPTEEVTKLHRTFTSKACSATGGQQSQAHLQELRGDVSSQPKKLGIRNYGSNGTNALVPDGITDIGSRFSFSGLTSLQNLQQHTVHVLTAQPVAFPQQRQDLQDLDLHTTAIRASGTPMNYNTHAEACQPDQHIHTHSLEPNLCSSPYTMGPNHWEQGDPRNMERKQRRMGER